MPQDSRGDWCENDGTPYDPDARIAELERDVRDMALLIRRHASAPGRIVTLSFEEVLNRPLDASRRVAAFLGVSLDVTRMAQAVFHRETACADGLAIETSLAESGRVHHGGAR